MSVLNCPPFKNAEVPDAVQIHMGNNEQESSETYNE